MRIKVLPFLLILMFSTSCSDRHIHDGKYEINEAFGINSVLELNGSEVTVKFQSSENSDEKYEFKTTCRQYNDRIEFLGEDGKGQILRISEGGNIKIGNYVYKKVKDE